jgi:uncharacterized membrane protein
MRVEESIHIDRPAKDVFAFLEVRANDVAWMAAVERSDWLDPTDAPGVGRRGRMVLRIGGRRHAFVDEVTDYQPGRRIAHRTVEGPLPLDTACICEPDGDGCRVTVIGAVDRLPGGGFGRLAAPVVARGLRRGFRADLANLKRILEANQPAVA